MRKFVVFYRVKNMSVALYANDATESDVKEFYKRTVDKIDEIKNYHSNSLSNSASCSCSDSASKSDSFVPEYKKFLDKILVCRIETKLISNSDFIKLLDYLNKFYCVYED